MFMILIFLKKHLNVCYNLNPEKFNYTDRKLEVNRYKYKLLCS